jgi:hypothetical protein
MSVTLLVVIHIVSLCRYDAIEVGQPGVCAVVTEPPQVGVGGVKTTGLSITFHFILIQM